MMRTVGTLFALALVLPAQQASAHPRLIKSTPIADAHVAAAPTEISVAFNEKVTVALSKLSLVDAAQKPVALDSVHSAATEGTTLSAKTTGKLAAGRYTVKWMAAGSDGHPMRGEFSFVVDPPAEHKKGAAATTAALRCAAKPKGFRRGGCACPRVSLTRSQRLASNRQTGTLQST